MVWAEDLGNMGFLGDVGIACRRCFVQNGAIRFLSGRNGVFGKIGELGFFRRNEILGEIRDR